ncbi:MAG: AAA family ATPase [Deltaproteobacteria bacterium]|nr:AAA family ATPase [Deltaproteobacteria bacterium]
MKEIFISTANFQRFQALHDELKENRYGIEMAAVVGQAGRGKTTAAQRIMTLDRRGIYLRFQQWFSPVGLLREVAFALGGERPRNTQDCFDIIREEIERRSPILFVDEADRMSLKHLNTLRDLHDLCSVPVVLIGEEPLNNRLRMERRIKSRVRQHLVFEPVAQEDLVVYYRKALEQSLEPAWAAALVRHSEGDFRTVVKDALAVQRYMRASGLKNITGAIINQVANGKG